jgi:hypothetical protein
MQSEHWHRVKEIFQRALELDESRRAEFLERSCGDDKRLRREVESLLSQDKKAEHFIDSPALEVVGKLVAHDAAKESGAKLVGRTGGFAAENGAGSESEMGERAAGIEADSEHGENNDLCSCKAHNVGVSPQEDRGVSAGAMGED